ncbi:helix-turn-helix domain-containing protein [Sphingobacterium sp. N143]|uniref:helix-turn-helix domain-containing protein n=1 Tax=Sphingobacterium sp. N143 TaxID=2746727 RepID=UPI002577AF0F|nr:helix-turn-helix domain-containing protein [Sphingobacterium sp. N143]MDM1293155.1 helix-turn-helix domain-containing protein [Sphingobacterium sp. N143]
MRREHLYVPFEIVQQTFDVCPKPCHQHSFFELVYIVSGTGKQYINMHQLNYKPGQLFLIAPQDYHWFDVATTTQSFILRFNNIYIKSKALQTENIQRLEFILHNANHQPTCLLKNQTDKALVHPIIEALIRETENKDLYHNEITQQLVNTLIIIVARNIAKYMPQKISETTEEKIVSILSYIQANIYEPEKLRAEAICQQFGVSENYLGRYFKKHSGETLQSYISTYKLALIEYRLKHSDKRINEIVAELGFTDESHLNKFFKQKRGLSPKAFRENYMNTLHTA